MQKFTFFKLRAWKSVYAWTMGAKYTIENRINNKFLLAKKKRLKCMRSVEWGTQIKSLRAYFAFILFHSINFINIRIHLLFITKKKQESSSSYLIFSFFLPIAKAKIPKIPCYGKIPICNRFKRYTEPIWIEFWYR